MKKIILIIITGLTLFVASLSAAVAVRNKINNTTFTYKITSSAGGSVIVDINGEQTDIKSGSNKTFSVKRKVVLKLTAIADNKHTFTGWEIDSKVDMNNEISVTASKDTEIKATYESKTINLTVDGKKDVAFPLGENLLEFLKENFPASRGMSKTFYIGSNKITESTKITEDTTITSEEDMIDYTIKFVINGTTIKTISYNITSDYENDIKPNIPSSNEPGYSYQWNTFILNNLENIEVLGKKIANEYTIKFIQENKETSVLGVTLDNLANITIPEIEPKAGWTIAWPKNVKEAIKNAIMENPDSDVIEIEAKSTINSYRVSFIYAGEEISTVDFITIENVKTTSFIEHLTIKGYDIASTDEDIRNAIVESINNNSENLEITIELNASSKTYTLQFFANNEKISESSVSYIDLIDENYTIETPSKIGYTIVWSENIKTEILEQITNSNTSIQVNAISYEENKYTIKFVTGNDKIADYSLNDKTYADIMSETITTPETPAGYEITWPSEDEIKTLIESQIEASGSKEITIKAKECKTIEYTVYFKDGEKTLGDPQKVTIESKTIATPQPNKESGYTYIWESSEGEPVGDSILSYVKSQIEDNSSDDKTIYIYLVCSANSYKVTLDNQSAATTAETAEFWYVYGENKYYSDAECETELSSITLPEKTGYTFGGYYTATNGSGTQYVDNSGAFVNELYKVTPSETETILYANWIINEYTITYIDSADESEIDLNPKSYTCESEEITLTNPTKEGYTFIGWTDASEESSEPSTEMKISAGSIGNKTFIAHWEEIPEAAATVLVGKLTNVVKIQYKLKSDDEFKDMPEEGLAATVGETYIFKAVLPEKAYYRYDFIGFSGWFSSVPADGTEREQLIYQAANYTINATAAESEEVYSNISINYYDENGDYANFDDDSLIYLREASRKGEKFYYIFDVMEYSITIEDYANIYNNAMDHKRISKIIVNGNEMTISNVEDLKDKLLSETAIAGDNISIDIYYENC